MKKTIKKNKNVSKKDKKNSVNVFLGNVKIFFRDFKEDPILCMILFFKWLGNYIKENRIFILFVFLNVLNAFLLRWFTIGNGGIYVFSPILADLFFVMFLGSFGYFMKKNGRGMYWVVTTIILSAICIINSAYYTFYTSFTSISLLSTAKFIADVSDAVFENVLQLKDLTYVLAPIIFIYSLRHYNKRQSIVVNRQKVTGVNFIIVSIVIGFLFCTTLTSTDIGRLTKQWNREYVVMKYGLYIYHVNDLIKSIEPKLMSLFGYDNAVKRFNEYFADIEESKPNRYTNMFEGKNIITIHAESIQNFVIGLEFNGVEVTPNLNKLANGGIYFDNFYSQVSVGTSSDTEFTLSTSLMPSNTGTAFGSYFDRSYISTPLLLKEMGYYTFSMHGNNADYWNRRVMHKTLGYDKFYAKSDYVIDEIIGLGISDKSFLKQSVEKIKEISEDYDKFYGTIITLTNHTPFSAVDKYGEFDVSIRESVLNEETGLMEEIQYPYMEGTKLGNYLKSVHYADAALGEFFALLDENGLLDDTVIVLYGDHDARLPIDDYRRLYNYDKEMDDVLPDTHPDYEEYTSYHYELNRKVPFIIYSKDKESSARKISKVMGMYDVMPTLGNMFGFKNEYALGHDIFSTGDDNIVIFPSGNWLTNKLYYNSQRQEYFVLNNSVFDEEYISNNSKYADDTLSVSNAIIVFDLIKKLKMDRDLVDEKQIMNEVTVYE